MSSRREPKPAAELEPAAPPKRLSLSAIVEMLLTRSSDHSTVSIGRTANGAHTLDVQVRTGSDDVRTIEDAETRAREVFARLEALYPPAAPAQDADVTLTRNAKGETQIAVELSTAAGTDIDTLGAALNAAGAAYESARAKFPLSSGAAGA